MFAGLRDRMEERGREKMQAKFTPNIYVKTKVLHLERKQSGNVLKRLTKVPANLTSVAVL